MGFSTTPSEELNKLLNTFEAEIKNPVEGEWFDKCPGGPQLCSLSVTVRLEPCKCTWGLNNPDLTEAVFGYCFAYSGCKWRQLRSHWCVPGWAKPPLAHPLSRQEEDLELEEGPADAFPSIPAHSRLCPSQHQPLHRQPVTSAGVRIYFHFKQFPEINKTLKETVIRNHPETDSEKFSSWCMQSQLACY